MAYAFLFLVVVLGTLSNRPSAFKKYLLGVCALLFLIIGLRSTELGPDTPSYVASFKRLCGLSWAEIIKTATNNREPLYLLVSWLPSLISSSYTAYLMVWALFPAIGLYTFFKNELRTPFEVAIAILVFFTIGLYAFFIAGIRQTAALSLILCGYKYFENIKLTRFYRQRSFYCFAILMLCAYLIHNSSIIFILGFLAKYITPRWWYVLIAFGMYFIATSVKLTQLTNLAAMVFDDRFAIYGNSYISELSMSGYFLQLILFVLCYLQKDRLIRANANNKIFFNMVFLGLICQSLTGLIGEMYRVSFFFSMFNLALVPRALSEYRKQQLGRIICPAFVCLVLVYLLFLASASLPEYHSVLD